MAGIITDVSEDIKRLQELKNEIESVKKSLKSIDIQVKLDIKESLEAQLKSLMGQYDSLVQKIGESEGKIMLSIRNINEATEKIINSQEKLSSSAKGMSGVSNIGTTDTSIETDGVKAQAKAYEELKTAIEDASGSVNQNIVLMMRMQETVNSYKKELKELEKGPKTDETVDRMAQITSEIEKGKLAIADYRRAFQSSLKIEFAASGSMNELSQQLGKMRSVYRDLTEEERNSPFGKELLVSIQQADTKIKELDASIGNHQRNVGNYGSVFDSVSGKLNEFASSASAIPGPVGNIASSIQGMTKASLAFIATPLGLVLAAISAALAAVSSWFHRTEKGENALNVATAAFSGTLNTLLDVVDNVGEWLFKCFTKPKEALSDLVDFLKGQLINRLKAVAKGAEAIFKIFSGDMSGISDFQNAWIQGLTGIEDAGKKYDAFIKKSVNNANERAKLAERQNVLDRKERENLVEKAKLEQKISELRAKGMDSSVSEKERAKAIKEASKLTNKMYNDEIALAKEKYEIIKKTNSLSHSNKADKEKEAQAEARLYQLESQRNNNQRMLTRQLNRVQNSQIQSKNKENAINQANEKFDETTRKNAEERMKLEASLEEMVLDARIKAMENGAEKVQAERDRQNEKELKQIEEQRKAAVEAEIKRQKQEFDAKQNVIKEKGGYVAQWDESMIDTTFIEQIDMQYKEIADSISESQKKMRLESDRKAWQEYFIEFGNYQEKRKNLIQKYDDEIAKAQNEGERLTLEKQRNKALRDKADEQVISKVDWIAAFGNLGTAFESVIKDTLAELDAYIQTDDFRSRSAEDKKTILDAQKNLQGNVSNDATFARLNRQIEEYRVNVQTLSMAEKVHLSAINDLTAAEQLRDSITDKNSKEYADASKKVAEAQKEVERTAELVTTANNTVAESQGRVSSTAVQLQGNLEKMSQGINQLTSGTLAGTVSGLENLIKGLGGSTAAIDKFKDLLKTGLSAVFGEQVGGLMSESLDIVEGVLTGDMTEAVVSGVLGMVDNILEGILKGGIITKPVNALLDGLRGIGNTLTFGGLNSWLDTSNAKEVAKTTERLTNANERLKTSIDGLKDEISNSVGVNSINSAREALNAQEKYIENQREILNVQQGYHGSHHSNKYYWNLDKATQEQINSLLAEYASKNNLQATTVDRNWSSFAKLSPEEMDYLRKHDAELWEKLTNIGKYDKSKYFDAFADLAGSMEEITDSLKEVLTTTTADNVFDDFLNSLYDLADGSEDVFDDIAESWQNMVNRMAVNNLVGANFQQKLKLWYDELAKLNEERTNSRITNEEYKKRLAALKDEYDRYVQSAKSDIDTLREEGIIQNVDSKSTSQSSTRGVFETMSQDTATELNGRFTALQIAGEEIKAQNIVQSQSLNILTMRTDNIISLQTETRNIADDTRSIIANSYLELQEIRENTGAIVKPIIQMQKDIAEVKQNTSRL